MKSKLLRVLLAGVFSMALQAEAAMVQWTFSGMLYDVSQTPETEFTFAGSFVYDTEERVNANGEAYHHFSNFMFSLNGVNMSIADGQVTGYAEEYGLGDMNYYLILAGINAFHSFYPNGGYYDSLSTPSDLSVGVRFFPKNNNNNNFYLGGADFHGSYINNVSAVPLPASALLFAPAALGVFGLRRKENS